jgi:hypothetical protein
MEYTTVYRHDRSDLDLVVCSLDWASEPFRVGTDTLDK